MKQAGIHLTGAGWRQSGGVWLCGEPQDPGNADPWEQHRVDADLTPTELARLGGRFAIVRPRQGGPQIAVDRVRSIPIWYAVGRDGPLISDDALWLQSKLGRSEPDPTAEAELRLLAYVTGGETLQHNIKQVQAAELVSFTSEDVGPAVPSAVAYAAFLPSQATQRDAGRLPAEWAKTLEHVIQRVVARIGSRPIVVPLSGGGDSRTLAVELQRVGHRDITCFSYGLPGNEESEISRSVAGVLGLRWTFVAYDRRSWRRWVASDEFDAYWAFAHGLTSVPHVQDWPAVWELRRRGEIADDAVIIPGHALDFLAGSHVPFGLLRGAPGIEEVARVIAQEHFHGIAVDAGPRGEARARIRQMIADLPFRGPADAVAAFEHWDWRERQAKFIANAVRVYEFWGYDWRLPYWDAEIMDFWRRVPLSLRAGGHLLNAHIAEQQRRLGLPPVRRASRVHRAARLLPDAWREAIGRRLRRARRRSEYERHPMGWYGMIPWTSFDRHYTGGEDINSFLVTTRELAPGRHDRGGRS